MKLNHILRQAEIVPNQRVIDRMAELQRYLRNGSLPQDLIQKLKGLPDGHRHSAARFQIIGHTLRFHRLLGQRLAEPFGTLAQYSLAYLWEEHDDLDDTMSNGLIDDFRVLERVSAHAKHELENLLLRTRRALIQKRWNE